MAGIKLHAPTGELSLTAGAAKTVAQLLAAANHRVIIKGYEVHGKGVLSTDTPMRVRLLRQTTPSPRTASMQSASRFCAVQRRWLMAATRLAASSM